MKKGKPSPNNFSKLEEITKNKSWRCTKDKKRYWLRGDKATLADIISCLNTQNISTKFSQVQNSTDWCIVIEASALQHLSAIKNTSSTVAAQRIQPLIFTPTFTPKPKKQDESLANDLNTLTTLEKLCKATKKGNKDDVSSILKDIGITASAISWNSKNSSCIRNRFGKFNFATSKRNSQFIDFDRLSHLRHLVSDPKFRDLTLRLLDQDEVNNDFVTLAQNCLDIKKIVRKKNKSQQIQLKNTSKLYTILDDLFDTYTLDILRRYCEKIHYENINKETLRDPKVRYHLARVICIVGEACKHLSESYKEAHPEFPFKTLSKIRDILVHNHGVTTALDTDEIIEIFEMMASSLMSLHDPFEKVVEQRCSSLEKTGEPEDDDTAVASRKLRDELKKRQDLQGKIDAIEQSISALQGNLDNYDDKKKKREKSKIAKKKGQLNKLLKKLEDLNIALGEFQVAPELNRALTLLQENCKNIPANFIERTQQNIKRLKTEMDLLKKWHKETNPNEERDFALEHVAGIVAEHCNLARSAYHRHVAAQMNPTAHENFRQTVKVRNQHVMHKPFDDPSTEVVDSLEAHTIPSYADITSIATLAQQQIRNITEHSDEWSIEAWHEYGLAHLRLQNYDEAVNCFEQVLYEIDKKLEQLKNPKQKQDPNVVTIVLVDFSPEKYLALTKLGYCYLQQKQIGKGIETLKEAYELFKRHHVEEPDLFTWECPFLLLNCLMVADDPSVSRFYKTIEQDIKDEDDADVLPVLQGQYASHLLAKNAKDPAAFKILENIDISKIPSPFNALSIQYCLYVCKAESAPADERVFAQLLQDAEALQEKFKLCHKKILKEVGHGASHLEAKLQELAKKTAHNYAAILSNKVIYKSGRKDGKDLQCLLTCLKIQEKYEIDTEATHYNIGLIYYDLSRNSHQKDQFLTTAIRHYQKSFKGDDSNNAFNFHRQISFAYEDLGNYKQALHHASRAYCMMDKFKYIPQDIQELSDVISVGLSKQTPKDNFDIIQGYMDKHLPQAECLITFYEKILPGLERKGIVKNGRAISSKLEAFKKEIKKRQTQLPPSKSVLNSKSFIHQTWRTLAEDQLDPNGNFPPPDGNSC